MYKQEKGQAGSGQAQDRWTITFVPSCTAQQATAAVAQGRAPPFLASTVASEQQLGLDSRLNMEPQPQASPYLQVQGRNLCGHWGTTLLGLQAA